jgi:hypothetical protein
MRIVDIDTPPSNRYHRNTRISVTSSRRPSIPNNTLSYLAVRNANYRSTSPLTSFIIQPTKHRSYMSSNPNSLANMPSVKQTGDFNSSNLFNRNTETSRGTVTPKLYVRNASDSVSLMINDSDSASIDVIYWPRTMTINRNSTTTRPKQRRLSVLATTIEVKSSEGLHGKTSYVA